MKFFKEILTLLLTVATATACDVMKDIHSDSIQTLRYTLRKFSKPRHHITNPRGKERARKYIRKIFANSGLHVWSEYIDTQPYLRGENIIGMLRGKHTGTADDRIVIVGAHYDTTSRTRGVDDNGSGVTALLQAAKQIGKSGCRFKNTILFVAFDFEEDTAESEHPIPFGSQYFVQNLTEYLSQTGGTVKGAIILEMLANHNTSKGSQEFPPMFSFISPETYKEVTLDGNRGNFLAVIGRRRTDEIIMKSLAQHYERDRNFKIQLVPIPLSGRPSQSPYSENLRDFYRSDHFNFWENSVTFPAVMVTDTSNFRGDMAKCYHRRCDSMKHIDWSDLEFLRRNTDAVIKATLELGEKVTGHSNNIRHPIKKTNAGLLTSTKTVDAETKTEDDQAIVFNSYSQVVSYTVLTIFLTLINCTFV
ncbi:uncharacterized protein LOC114523199 [Dendronephthya gigantea]|uniref:uncharacterized protein LOC114523199 n=1 Tax=Dendronephthya gigantea TaxID=151771 RepID=UPI00106C0851|nr:uncharacterized protein LOC114523199 [Dendronephthya gigantea]